MRFGLFGSAAAPRSPGVATTGQGFFDFVETNVEAEALGFHSSFVTEHTFSRAAGSILALRGAASICCSISSHRSPRSIRCHAA